MAALFLTHEEIEHLTGRKRCKEQSDTLTKMGVRWQVNAAGVLIVGRRHVEQVLSGEGLAANDQERKKPNLKALNG
ncbi:DUF4224 domain-containing protein [Halomonas sp. 86]|uniref:DUF4224 domain-containing protein n=1 Tax=unclassified Halomonas TaxID=2609666 RepID=UPI004034D70D